MRRSGSLVLLAGAAVLAAALGGCARSEKAQAGIAWQTSLDAALADAKAHHRDILLDFYADW